jgi:hypothetical protein
LRDLCNEAIPPGRLTVSYRALVVIASSPGGLQERRSLGQRSRTTRLFSLKLLDLRGNLPKGKKPYSIGQDLSAWIEKLFEVNIKPNTLRMRAKRFQDQDCTNVHNDSTPLNDSEKEDNQSPLSEIKAPRQHRATGKPMGGKRDSAGRPKKKRPQSQPNI